MPEPGDESQEKKPPTVRLVIRVGISSEEALPEPVRRRLSKRSLLLILGAVVALLSWVGVSSLRTSRPPAIPPQAGTQANADARVSPQSQSAPVPSQSEAPLPVKDPPPAQPATPSAETDDNSTRTRVNEVIPNVPRSARETIRGTIKVTVRVTVDKEGKVLAATADDAGPSRYFERLAVEAAKKWTYTPVDLDQQRLMLVKFSFTRAGTTAHSDPLQ